MPPMPRVSLYFWLCRPITNKVEAKNKVRSLFGVDTSVSNQLKRVKLLDLQDLITPEAKFLANFKVRSS